MGIAGSVLWRRLDGFGSDACSLARRAGGWRLVGAASFAHYGMPVALAYCVDCGEDWHAVAATVNGFWGAGPIEIGITRADSETWRLTGAAQAGLPATLDLDLAFTPATNLLAIRRLDLGAGEEAAAPAAWPICRRSAYSACRSGIGGPRRKNTPTALRAPAMRIS